MDTPLQKLMLPSLALLLVACMNGGICKLNFGQVIKGLVNLTVYLTINGMVQVISKCFVLLYNHHNRYKQQHFTKCETINQLTVSLRKFSTQPHYGYYIT